MPSEEAHLKLASRNQATIDHLLCDVPKFSEWITTIAFYKAVHLVEAVFSRDPNIRHTHDHKTRELQLKKTKKYAHLWKHYRPLWTASLIARYLEDLGGTAHSSFSDYLSPEKVQDEILNHRLKQVENSANTLLGKPV